MFLFELDQCFMCYSVRLSDCTVLQNLNSEKIRLVQDGFVRHTVKDGLL